MTGARLQAVVFDLDGVLWDGEPLYHEAFNVVLRPFGCVVTAEDYVSIIGSSTEAAWQWVLDHCGIEEPLEGFLRSYDETVLKMLERPIEPLPGVRDVLERLRAADVPLGLASASYRQWVDATLAGLALRELFEATASASEVAHAKPAPDLYLLAAERLGVAPSRCLAVEDTLTGIQAAKAAGMHAVQVRASSTALPPLSTADAVIDAYADFPYHLLID